MAILSSLERRVACSGVVSATAKAWRQMGVCAAQARLGGLAGQGGGRDGCTGWSGGATADLALMQRVKSLKALCGKGCRPVED